MQQIGIGLEELAQLLRVDYETARDLLVAGDIPAAKIGRSWVVLLEDAVAYLKEQVQSQTAKRRGTKEAPAPATEPMPAQVVIPYSLPKRPRGRPLPPLPPLPEALRQPART